jgi:dihydrofolate reductase
MKAIVAVDSDWGIGCCGKSLFRIPEDLKFFKEMTLGKVVVMGKETFESLPGREPLKDRTNIVLSREMGYRNAGVIVCHSLEEFFTELRKYDTEDVFVIGGESIYSQLLKYCREAYVTKIYGKRTADKYFTDLDREKSWKLAWSSDLQTYRDIEYKFTKYENISEEPYL